MLSITVRYSIFNGFFGSNRAYDWLVKNVPSNWQVFRWKLFLFVFDHGKKIERKNVWLTKEDQKRMNEEEFARRTLKVRMGEQALFDLYISYCWHFFRSLEFGFNLAKLHNYKLKAYQTILWNAMQYQAISILTNAF